MQLFVRQPSGEIEPIAPMTIASALHPILLTTGELMFSSAESQGHRDQRLWALWSIYPDGRNWRPLVSGFEAVSVVPLPGATIERRNRRDRLLQPQQLGLRHAARGADAAPGAGVP